MIRKNIHSRRARETRLKIYGISSICFALIMLATLLISIGLNGYSALQQAYFKVDISVNTEKFVDESGDLNNKKMWNIINWIVIIIMSVITLYVVREIIYSINL